MTSSLSRLHRATRIRELNDLFRADPGTAAATEGFLLTFGKIALPFVLEQVRAFRDFTPGDPYAEHESGVVHVAEHAVFWRIVYATPDLAAASPDPADPSRTRRVLHLMLLDELAEAA